MTDPIHELPIVCPYCGESVTLVMEADLRGELVTDCEVCCHPWRVRIQTAGDEPRVEISRLDD